MQVLAGMVSVRLELVHLARLQRIAKRRNRKVSELVRQIVVERLERRPAQKEKAQ